MLKLRTFGGLLLEDESGPVTGAAAQRRKLALLALLAAAGERGVSRDKLVAYFWPESDTTRARNSLAQLLYALRQALPVDPVAIGSTELRLNPEVICSDAGEFDCALQQGDREHAVALYTGPFLDGFHLPDSPEFDRWAETERSRRAQQVRSALEELASNAGRSGDLDGAAQRWGQLAAFDPLDSRIALALMHALEAAGNRPGALQHARVHDALVRDQLGIAPDAAVLDFVHRLRAAPAPIAEPPPVAAHPRAEGEGGDSNEQPRLAVRRGRGYPLGRRLVPALVLAVAILSVLWLALAKQTPAKAAAGSPSVVAVLPFEVRGDVDIGDLGPGMVDLLSTNLDGAGMLRSVDPRALLSALAADSIRAK